jgi:hypothetical protein
VARFLEAHGAARSLHERNAMGVVPLALYLGASDVTAAVQRRAVGRPAPTPSLGPLTPSAFLSGAVVTTIMGGGHESTKTAKQCRGESGAEASKNSRIGSIVSSGGSSRNSSGGRMLREPRRPSSAPPRSATREAKQPMQRQQKHEAAAATARPSAGAFPALPTPTTARLEGSDKAFVKLLLDRTARSTTGGPVAGQRVAIHGSITHSAATRRFAESVRGTVTRRTACEVTLGATHPAC